MSGGGGGDIAFFSGTRPFRFSACCGLLPWDELRGQSGLTAPALGAMWLLWSKPFGDPKFWGRCTTGRGGGIPNFRVGEFTTRFRFPILVVGLNRMFTGARWLCLNDPGRFHSCGIVMSRPNYVEWGSFWSQLECQL